MARKKGLLGLPGRVSRRGLLTWLTGGFATLGGLFSLVPFFRSMSPSDRTKAIGGPVSVSLGELAEGELRTVEWRGKPVWLYRRSSEQVRSLAAQNPELADPTSRLSRQPDYASGDARSRNPEIMVLVGICTHLGCSPGYFPDEGDSQIGDDWKGGFFCACHGSRFDLAGRVHKNMPAPLNLEVPPYYFADDETLVIGEDQAG